MNKVIYKYEVKNLIQMPIGAEILDAQIQNGKIIMWALVDKSQGYEERSFRVLGTGHELDFEGKYIATCQEGFWVWHVFEVIG